jgi:hypothetical protein
MLCRSGESQIDVNRRGRGTPLERCQHHLIRQGHIGSPHGREPTASADSPSTVIPVSEGALKNGT